MLVACSEDIYHENYNIRETGTVENNSGDIKMAMTVSSGYDAAFQPYGSPSNENIITISRNNTSLNVSLKLS